jgi:hypothetical protein
MSDVNVEQIARLSRERNAVDEKIASIIQRPMTAGLAGPPRPDRSAAAGMGPAHDRPALLDMSSEKPTCTASAAAHGK